MKTKWEIILAGYGGQGLGQAGQLLAEAAIIYRDLKVAHNQSYGAQARGGASQSSVIISSDPIIFPIVEKADILVALSPEGYTTYEPQVNSEGGIIIYDSSVSIKPAGKVKEQGYPFRTEIEKQGHPRGITLMALGTVLQICQLISPDAVLAALQNHFTGKILDLNVKAFQLGQVIAKN
jgi:2-oxoglutarate ferredoxin oxidoreductase subunit gamma